MRVLVHGVGLHAIHTSTVVLCLNQHSNQQSQTRPQTTTTTTTTPNNKPPHPHTGRGTPATHPTSASPPYARPLLTSCAMKMDWNTIPVRLSCPMEPSSLCGRLCLQRVHLGMRWVVGDEYVHAFVCISPIITMIITSFTSSPLSTFSFHVATHTPHSSSFYLYPLPTHHHHHNTTTTIISTTTTTTTTTTTHYRS